jgi:hypothetical protein
MLLVYVVWNASDDDSLGNSDKIGAFGRRHFESLTRVASYKIRGNQLELFDSADTSLLIFDRAAS